jgi:succinoglycan biosynthesis transport protein ExoP
MGSAADGARKRLKGEEDMEGVGERPSTLRDYLAVLWRRKWVVLQALVLVPVAAVYLSLRQPALYQASADVLVNADNLSANLVNINDPSQLDPDRRLRTLVVLARVPTVAKQAIAAAKLHGWSASDLLGASSVSPGQENDILTFSVTNRDPALATRLATEYARQFTIYRRELDTKSLRQASRSAQNRIDGLKDAGLTRSGLYASLVEQQQRLETLQAFQTSRAVLVRPATGAGKVQPQPKRNAILGIALGLALGLGFAVLLEALDSRVRSAETITDKLRLLLLARIPQPRRRFRGKKQLVVLSDPNGPEAEAFRILRTNLELANIQHGAHTIMITSAVEKEGKSTTIANLALALAGAGRRVVLVDLDLRNASQHSFFNLPLGPGLTDVAVRHVPLSEAIRQVDVRPTHSYLIDNEVRRLASSEGRLEVLSAGTLPLNPGEFIAQLPIVTVLEELKERGSIVLIDGPPLLRVGDAIALSSAVDALLVVARIDVVRMSMLEDLGRILRACPAAKLGLVIAGAELETGYQYLSYPRHRQKTVT